MIRYSTNTLMVSILVLVAVIPLLIFGFFLIGEDKKLIEDQQLINLRGIINSQKEKTTIFFNEKLSDVLIISKIPFVQNNIYILFENGSQKDIQIRESFQTLFKNILDTYNYESIWVVDNNLKTKLVVGHDTTPMMIPSPDTLEQMKIGLHLSDIYGSIDGGHELFVSIPIIVDDIQLGYLIFDIDVDLFFKATLFELELSDTGETVVVQKQHDDVFFVKPLRFDDSAFLSKPLSPDTNLAIPALKSVLGMSGFGISIDYRGEEVLAAWDYIPLTRWGIVAKIDTSEAFLILEQRQRDIIITVFPLIATAFVVGLVLSRISTNPLKKIRDATIHIAEKKFNVQIIPQGPVEQREIAISCNKMVKSLQENKKIIDEHIAKLKIADTQKDEFAAMTSHELKTPLVPIQGYCEMLLEEGLIGKLNPEQCESIEKILFNTKHLHFLIERILTAQQLDLGRQNWKFGNIILDDFMTDIYQGHLSMMKEKNINFLNTTTQNQNFYSDVNQLYEVFTNIIQNAVDFTPKNGDITINAEINEHDILFSIKNNGEYIPKDKQQHLFKKFYQIDTSITRKHGGAGLGLTICKGIVNGLGGKIWVNSEKGLGVEFYFTIPTNNNLTNNNNIKKI